MIEYYLALRQLHIGCAILTIALFTFRGGLMMAGSPLLGGRVLRFLPMAVDTVLLATALMLASVIQQYPFTAAWLTMKVVLLVAYIGLGTIALRPGRTKAVRIAAYFAALATVGFLLTVARTHSPLGIFS